MSIRAALALGCLAALSSSALAQSFNDGEIILVSSSLPNNSSAFAGVMRIDPATWTKSVIYSGSAASVGRSAYDPYRDRVVAGADGVNSGLTLIAADGSLAHLPYAGSQDLNFPAATGDGRIYVIHSGGQKNLAYFDASSVLHNLLKSDGVSIATAGSNVQATYFDLATSSLYIGTWNGGLAPLRVERVVVNAAGDQIVSRQSVDFTGGGSGEAIVGLSAGPSGTVFVKIDDNSGAAVARMMMVNPATMTATTFASSQYFGVGGEVAGVYSPALGKAVVLDSLNDVLRSFAQGSSGAGVVVTGGVSSIGGSGEMCQLLSVAHAYCGADFDHSGFVDTDDFDAFVQAFEAGLDPADFDHSGFVDTDDFDAFVHAFEDGC